MNRVEFIAILIMLDELMDKKDFDGANRLVKRLLIEFGSKTVDKDSVKGT
ncbi:hypothetical protein FACS1894133_7380 [Clostridia bacterium]|nr:hypothetical protein FACS1894133_7380 [Clostridia bacterium]